MLVPVHAAVYRLRGAPYTQDLRWLAAVLAGGDGAVLSHQAAATTQHFDIRRLRPVVTTPHQRHPEHEGITFHRSRRLGPSDTTVVRGIPITSRPRTVLDCASVLPFAIFESLVQDAVARGLVTVESLLAVIDRRGGRGVGGTVALRAALEGGLVDEKIESKLELLVARIIDQAPIPRPVRQYELTCVDGRRVRLDNAWVEYKIAVEPEGRRWHGNAHQARATRERARSITRSGWDRYAYGWGEAVETPDAILSEVTAAVLGAIRHGRAA